MSTPNLFEIQQNTHMIWAISLETLVNFEIGA